MSQPGNYRYQSYADPTGSMKAGPPPMVNGQPSAMQHTQNGVQQPTSLNSAGTPSSQSSRDPSREPSRDPSPTQYLHNQYRPQLSRPPMPTINGQHQQQQQHPGLSHVPMSLPPRGLQPRQSSPLVNPQNRTNQFAPMQSSSPSTFSTQSSQLPPSTVPPSISTDSQQISGQNQSQKSVTPTRYDYPSPNRSLPGTPSSQTGPESQGRPSPMPTLGQPMSGQCIPPTGSIQAQSSWSKESSASSSISNTPSQANPASTTNQPWRNPNADPNSDNSQMTSQPFAAAQSANSTQGGASPQSWNKEGTSSVLNAPNQPAAAANPMQSWRNPNGDQNPNNPQTYSAAPSANQQQGGALPQSWNKDVSNSSTSQLNTGSPSQNPAARSQPPPSLNPAYGPPPMGGGIQQSSPFSQQSQQPAMGNKAVLGDTRPYQTAPALTSAVNSSMQNVFGNNTQSGQFPPTAGSQLENQKLAGPQLTHPAMPKSQAQYPATQVNAFASPPPLTGSGVNQTTQSAYGSQQNLASQRKYPQGAYGGQLPPGSPNIAGPPLGPNVNRGPPTGMGQVPMRPPTSGAPPLPGQQTQSQPDNRSPYFGQMSNVPLDNMAKRYPTTSYPDQMNQLNTQMGNLNVTQTGFNELWGQQTVDLLQCRNVLPPEKVEPPKIKLHQEFLDRVNCSPDIFRCTLTRMPESNSLLQKCRLPLGILIHPFKDLNHLPVIQCSTIVRCRSCRTYINPFVYFIDCKRWKCNLCYRVNELPEEFQFDPVTKSYGDPSRRPEVKTSTIEFIASSEYMLRPPQPAVYLFLLDVSRLAVESGYLSIVCETIAEELTKLPGDGRTQVGFMAIDSAIHFFSMPDNVSQPHELIMLDVDDVFLPCPDNLIVNLKEREELIRDLLAQLPTKFNGTHDTNSALGAGLQAAFKLMSPTGGRVTVFQTCLPNVGPGALQQREDPNTRASKDVPHLNPATDFYKRLALDCSGQQIAVDLFLLNSQYSDLATLSGMCKFSGGCIYHIPLFRTNKPQHSETLEKMLRRYLTRKIGFEAVLRIRCTRGLSIHTFHGNFFVRSTDLLSLPNINPDAGFGMQVSIEENLADIQSACFQASLLYTSSKGERRIRVHTLCIPVSASMSDILYSADQQAMIGLLSKMAVDRSQQSSLSDARDALINVAIDVLSAYKLSQSAVPGGLLAPGNLKLLPLYIIATIKSIAFRSGTSTRLDDRVFAMCQMKSLPLIQLIQMVYPDLYPIHALDDRNSKDIDGKVCPQPPRLHLSAEKLDFRGAFLLDAGDRIFIYVGKNVDPMFCFNVLGVQAFTSIPEECYDLPELDTVESERLRNFVFSLQEEKPYYAPLQIIRDDSHFRTLFTDRLIEDRFESALSYYEFLQHLKTQVK